MQNADDLIKELEENKALMLSGERHQRIAKEVTNMIGKQTSIYALKLKYQGHMGFEDDIDFFYTKEERLKAIENSKK